MDSIKVMPSVLVHRIFSGGGITGVDPVSVTYSMSYDNLAAGVFSAGDSLTWTGGTGTLLYVSLDGTEGDMTFTLDSGVAPYDNLEITNAIATCDVNGPVLPGVFLDSGEGLYRGRYRHISGLTDGGLVGFPVTTSKYGFRVTSVSASLPGVGSVLFSIVDMYGNEAGAGSVTLASGAGYYDWRNGGIFVAPGCSFKAASTDSLTGNGQIMFTLGQGWGASVFDESFPTLGAMYLPPSR